MQATSVVASSSEDVLEAAQKRAEMAQFVRRVNTLIGRPIPAEWSAGNQFVLGDKTVQYDCGVSAASLIRT
jgi:hypothetical protein